MKKYLAKYRTRCVFIGLLVFLLHGAKLNSHMIGIDTEDLIRLQGDFYGGWLHTGRQGLVFIKYLLGNLQFNPYYTGVMTLLFFAASVWAFLLLWDRVSGCMVRGRADFRTASKNRLADLWAWGLGGLLWISHPAMAEQFYFSLQSLEICICLLLTALSLYLSYLWAKKFQLVWAIESIVLLLLTFSCYQSFVVLYIFGTAAIVFLQTLKDIQRKRELTGVNLLKRVLPYMIVFGVAFLINMLITKLFFSSSNYLKEQILWGKAETKDCIHAVIGHVVKAFTGYDSIFYHWGLGVLAIIDLALLIRFLLGNVKGRKGVVGVTLFYYLSLLAAPFMMTVLLGCSPAIRSQLVLPVLTGFMGYLGIWFVRIEGGREKVPMREIRYKKIVFLLIGVMGVITGMEQAKVTERLYYTDRCRYEQDAALGRSMIERIEQANQGDDSLPVFVVGGREFTGNHACVTGEIIGRSFFSYDMDVLPRYYWSTRRALGFLHSLGADYNQLAENQVTEALGYASDMPVWPSEDSVQERQGMIIIKLSDEE